MAGLQPQTMVNEFTSYYISNPTEELDLIDPSGNIVALTASGNELLVNGVPASPENWSLYPAISNTIMMDSSGNDITNVGTDLYFAGNLLAQASNVPNLQDWALYPAIQNVDFSGNDLLNGGNATIIKNATIGGQSGQGFGLFNYWMTSNQGDFRLENATAILCNANRPV